jgi:hypothetical protein
MYVCKDIPSQYRFLPKRSNLLSAFDFLDFLVRVAMAFPIFITPNEGTCKWLMMNDNGNDKDHVCCLKLVSFGFSPLTLVSIIDTESLCSVLVFYL